MEKTENIQNTGNFGEDFSYNPADRINLADSK